MMVLLCCSPIARPRGFAPLIRGGADLVAQARAVRSSRAAATFFELLAWPEHQPMLRAILDALSVSFVRSFVINDVASRAHVLSHG